MENVKNQMPCLWTNIPVVGQSTDQKKLSKREIRRYYRRCKKITKKLLKKKSVIEGAIVVDNETKK